MVGLHNSYHQEGLMAPIVQSWKYNHPGLAVQLDLGIRELELDVHLQVVQHCSGHTVVMRWSYSGRAELQWSCRTAVVVQNCSGQAVTHS